MELMPSSGSGPCSLSIISGQFPHLLGCKQPQLSCDWVPEVVDGTDQVRQHQLPVAPKEQWWPAAPTCIYHLQ